MTDIKDQPLQQFLNELASKAATPGGGSAAAVMGAQSAALTSMVCNLTLGKPKYAEVEADMQALLEKSEALRSQLTELIKADVDSFNQLMAAYGLPKDTEAQQAARGDAIQQALSAATEVPLQCAAACRLAIEHSRIAAEKGNTGVISDAGAAVMAGYGGLKTAALNVYINTGSLKDKTYATAKLAELTEILAGMDVFVEATYQLVKNRL